MRAISFRAGPWGCSGSLQPLHPLPAQASGLHGALAPRLPVFWVDRLVWTAGGKGKRWGPQSGHFPEVKGRLRNQGAFQQVEILQAQGRKKGSGVVCEAEIREVLGSGSEKAAEVAHCSSIPLNLSQGRQSQSQVLWRVVSVLWWDSFT